MRNNPYHSQRTRPPTPATGAGGQLFPISNSILPATDTEAASTYTRRVSSAYHGTTGSTRITDANASRKRNALLPISALRLLRQDRDAFAETTPLYLVLRCRSSRECVTSYPWLQLTSGMMHELSGPAGTGKTQIALALCVQAAVASGVASTPETTTADHLSSSSSSTSNQQQRLPPSASIRAVYLALGSTRLNHVVERLRHMSDSHDQQQQGNHDTTTNRSLPSSEVAGAVLQRILVKCCVSVEELLPLVTDTLPALLQQQPNVRILVLDNIASVVRYNDENRTPVQRAALLFRLSAALQSLLTLCHMCHHRSFTILVLNEVTANIAKTTITDAKRPTHQHHSHHPHISQPMQAWTPALGLSWRHCVHSRFSLHRHERQCTTAPPSRNDENTITKGNHSSNESDDTIVFDRTIQLVHSNRFAPAVASFVIETAGCYLVDIDASNANV